MKLTTPTNVALTGYAGVGKTTLIRNIATDLAEYNPVGFYTAEIRERGARMGFELYGLDGSRAVFAHVDSPSSVRVGRYGVDIPTFEAFLARLRLYGPDQKLVVIDEIGRMECHSAKFVQLVSNLLDSDQALLTTVAMRGSGLIRKVKRRNDTVLFEITIVNRGRLRDEIRRSVLNAYDA